MFAQYHAHSKVHEKESLKRKLLKPLLKVSNKSLPLLLLFVEYHPLLDPSAYSTVDSKLPLRL